MVRVFVLGLLVGCGVDPIDVDVCGNGVVESGEDCDSRALPEHDGQAVTCEAPAAVNECRYSCGTTVCPSGWQCGADKLCRHATGRYAPIGVSITALGDVEVGDLDGDTQADLVVSGLDNLEPLFGAGDGTFSNGRIVPLVFPTPTAAVGDLDADGRTDVLAGTFTGFVQLHGEPARTLNPFPQPAFTATPPGFRHLPIQVVTPLADTMRPNHHVLRIGGVPFQAVVVDQSLDFDHHAPVTVPGGFALADLAGVPARADVNNDNAHDIAIVFIGAAQAHVYLPQVSGGFVDGLTQRTIALPALADTNGAQFADVDNDGDLDLLVGVDSGPLPGVAVALNTGGGNFGAATVSTFFDNVAQTPGSNAWPLTPIDLGDPRPGWINNFGIFRDLGTPLLVDFNNLFLWAEAVVGDFNRDGLQDMAATVGGKAGLDVFLQTPAHLFAHTRVVTARAPTNLRVGDFDGDGTTDLAFRESKVSGVGPFTVSASFGSAQGLTTPVALGDWADVTTLEPMSIFLVGQGFRDGVDDLFVQGVIDDGSSGQESLSFLIGSYQRVMLAPYEARITIGSTFSIAPDVAVIGQFDSDPDVDVAMLEFFSRDGIVPAAIEVAVASGTGRGNLSSPATLLSQAAPLSPALDTTGLGFGCSAWRAADLDGDGIDDLIGFTRQFGFCLGAPIGLVFVGNVDGGSVTFTQLEDGVVAPARDVRVVDVDGVGGPEILIVGDGRATVYFRDSNGAFTGTDVITGQPFEPLGLAALNADADPEVELAVATRDGVTLFDVEGRTFTNPRSALDGFAGHVLHVADVNGDRLPDLIVQDIEIGELRAFFAIASDAEFP